MSVKQNFFKRGEPFVWFTGAALTLTMAMTLILIWVVLANALGHFWPSPVFEYELKDGTVLLGQEVDREPVPNEPGQSRINLKIGNREYFDLGFKWLPESDIVGATTPEDAVILERETNLNFIGRLIGLKRDGETLAGPEEAWSKYPEIRGEVTEMELKAHEFAKERDRVDADISSHKDTIKKIEYYAEPGYEESVSELQTEISVLTEEYNGLNEQYQAEIDTARKTVGRFRMSDGREVEQPLVEIVRAYRPNEMGFFGKCGFYVSKVWELLTTDPREANQDGGLFPAIFGTILMVFLMSLLSVPLGVVAAIYLREYAKDGWLVRVVRVAVNNLAGVPSIVFGIFGLGFFVYTMGSGIDQQFFPEKLPDTPTFGTGGILWASLTLALLTVPVVIVSTEEGLAAIPKGIRDGSIALGATRFQTLWRILVPMASPGIMTGVILAMARAAGEVAPLMLVGVMKIASSLPLDGQFPYFHAERKFMHLGFHIYDMGFQSPNVEAVKPMVYVTTLLLLGIVLSMSMVAIVLRNRMQKRFQAGIF